MNPLYDDELDFVEIPGSKTRKIHKMEVNQRSYKMHGGMNTLLDMRIVNKEIITDDNNIAHIHLIFKLDYHPRVFIDEYTIFANFKVNVFDRNKVLRNQPLSDLSVAYLAMHYKENGERLFEEINKQSKNKFFSSLHGEFTITENESQEETRKVLQAYFGQTNS